MRTPDGYRRVIAFGETGSGKSRLLQLIADKYARTTGDVWVLDCRRIMPRPLRGVLLRPQEEMMDLKADAPYFDFVNAWCEQGYKHAVRTKQSLMLHIDETDLAVKSGGNHGVPPALVRVVMQGRAHGVSYCFAVRRPVEIPPVIRSQAEDLFFFRMTDWTDVQVARQKRIPLMGPQGIQDLKRGQFWHCVAGHMPHFHASPFSGCAPE